MKSRGGVAGVVLLVAMTAGNSGCRVFDRTPIHDAMSYERQSTAIQRIVPLGTDRETALRKLKAAGIVGEFATKDRSVYHCDLWNRSNGERRHLTIALLFDDQKKLYAVRPSDFDAPLVENPSQPGVDSLRAPSTRPAHSRQLPLSQDSATGRQGRRTPFAGEN